MYHLFGGRKPTYRSWWCYGNEQKAYNRAEVPAARNCQLNLTFRLCVYAPWNDCRSQWETLPFFGGLVVRAVVDDENVIAQCVVGGIAVDSVVHKLVPISWFPVQYLITDRTFQRFYQARFKHFRMVSERTLDGMFYTFRALFNWRTNRTVDIKQRTLVIIPRPWNGP